MRLVVDTNIVFSALLNTNNQMVDILLHPNSNIRFFTPVLLKEEIHRYSEKLTLTSKIGQANLLEATEKIMRKLNFISHELIADKFWKDAYHLTKDIDPSDIPFVALALDLNCKLWTGDKKLALGLKAKGIDIIIKSSQIKT